MGAFHLDVSAHFYADFCPFAGGGLDFCFEKLGMVQNSSLPLPATLFPYQQSKLEKADILEMTVKHLQNIQSSKLMGECRVPPPCEHGQHWGMSVPAGLNHWHLGKSIFQTY